MKAKNQLMGVNIAGWWEPVRAAVLQFAGAPVASAPSGHAILDFLQEDEDVDLGLDMEQLPMPRKVLITYISRQAARHRKLVEDDHVRLVRALEELVEKKGEKWELEVIVAENLTKDEQLRIAARTTFLIGVHGNGLTHLVFMPPTRISTVIEIFYPGGFAHDYQWTTHVLGMRHYAVWNDTYHTSPHEPRVDYPEGFQGDFIPVHGPSIARLIEERVEARVS